MVRDRDDWVMVEKKFFYDQPKFCRVKYGYPAKFD